VANAGAVFTRRLGGALAIARNTFREAMRDRVLYLVAAFGVIVLISGKIVGWVSIGEDIVVVRSIGLSAIPFFGAMIAIFVGTGLIQRELGGRTIYTILARPVARWEFVIGKYLGLVGTVLGTTVAMGGVFLFYLAVVTHFAPGDSSVGALPPAAFGWPVFQSLLLSGAELVVITAIAVFFSSISTPIMSAVFTFFAYLAGQFASDVAMYSDMLESNAESPAGQFLLDALYRIMPNLDLMNIRMNAVHGIATPDAQIFWTMLYAVAYAGLTLVAGCALFERRNLP
jgi:ABC-type transport system involved in multi-copper enzyme maturation permease subunit